jgi:hypothetical protein
MLHLRYPLSKVNFTLGKQVHDAEEWWRPPEAWRSDAGPCYVLQVFFFFFITVKPRVE